jgi:hypothetical protein
MARVISAGIAPNGAAESDLALGASSRRPRRLAPQSIALAVALSGCSGQADADPPRPSPEPTKAEADPSLSASQPEGPATLTGVRISEGNAVTCAEIRSDDGTVHPVSGLTGEVAIGDRITVTGTFGVSTSCVGRVLIIQDVKRL